MDNMVKIGVLYRESEATKRFAQRMSAAQSQEKEATVRRPDQKETAASNIIPFPQKPK